MELSAPIDGGNEIKRKQATRLEEVGSFEYFKAFAVFLPHLFPKDDWRVWFALSFRVLFSLSVTVVDFLEPQGERTTCSCL
jgi:hypothetical protein